VEHDAWLIDLDGTLYYPLPLKLAMAAEVVLLGTRAIGTLRRFRHEHEELRALPEQGEVPYRTQLERTAVALGGTADQVEAVVAEWMQARPCPWIRRFRRKNLLAEIEHFRNAGGKTAIVSDYPARRKLDALGAAALFDAIVANGEPGGPRRLKPSPEGYLLAAERLGVRPEKCLVIGDRDDADGLAARAAHMAFRRIG